MEIKNRNWAFVLLCVCLCLCAKAQSGVVFLPKFNFDTETKVWLDDYQNVYIQNQNKSIFAKYSSDGVLINELLLPNVYQLNSVQNPMFLCLFSENLQQLRFLDQNLFDRQAAFNFQDYFGFVKAVYVEDYQYIWVLDQTKRRLVQFNLANKTMIQSFMFDFSVEDVLQLLVYKNKVYLLKKNALEIYSLSMQLEMRLEILEVQYLDVYQKQVHAFSKNSVQIIEENLKNKVLFKSEEALVVGRNFENFFAIIKNKFYLYPIKL